jgi:hypothetical protein
MSLLATRDLTGLRRYLGEKMIDFDTRLKVLQSTMKTGSRISKHRARGEARDLIRTFLPHVEKYLEKYGVKDQSGMPILPPNPPYELIGFLRLFPP